VQATHRQPDSERLRRERLALLGIVALEALWLLALSRWLTVFEDEANIVFTSSMPPLEVAHAFLRGEGLHEHPPLWDLLLHGWITLTGGGDAWLRLPSIALACASIVFVAETAGRLWGRRLPAALIAVAWPTGALYSVPAHWMPLTMCLVAASTWAYVRVLQSERMRDMALFTVFAVALVFTNYLGLFLLAALALHLLSTRPPKRLLAMAAAAAFVVLVSVLPLAFTFARVTENGLHLRGPVGALIATGYYAYVLLVSESVAPWQWPAVFVAIGVALLLFEVARTRTLWPAFGAFASMFAVSVTLGVVGARRAGIFGPWLVLLLSGLVVQARSRPRVAAGLALIFGTGWLGLALARWPASFRYHEPWRQVAAQVLDEARPGDLVVVGHPSFYYYAHVHGGWPGWPGADPAWPSEHDGVVFAAQNRATVLAPMHQRITLVRTVVHPPWAEATRDLDALLARSYRKTGDQAFVHDRAAAFKTKLLAHPQPEWRIRIERYERR